MSSGHFQVVFVRRTTGGIDVLEPDQGPENVKPLGCDLFHIESAAVSAWSRGGATRVGSMCRWVPPYGGGRWASVPRVSYVRLTALAGLCLGWIGYTAHEQSAPLSSHRRWGANCARGRLLRAQLNVAARPGACRRAPAGQATSVGPPP